MPQKSGRCFCAFCKSPRSVYAQKHISTMDVFLVALASVLLGWLIWQDLDPRGFMFFGFGLGMTELFVIFRRRFSIACPKCGFDLLLYRKSPHLAAERVKEFRAERMEDPLWVFAPPPQMQPRRKAAPPSEVKSKGDQKRIPFSAAAPVRTRGSMPVPALKSAPKTDSKSVQADLRAGRPSASQKSLP